MTSNRFLQQRFSIRNLICFLVAFIALMDSFVMWNDPLVGKLINYGLKFLNLFALFYLLQHNVAKKYIWAILIIPFSWVLWEEESLLSSLQYVFSATVPIMTFLLLKDEEQLSVVKSFLKIWFVLFIIGLPIYALLLTGLNIPHIDYIRDSDQRLYQNYFFLYYAQGNVLYRFSSVWDEPGVVGTMAAIVVLYYRNLLTKRQYYIFLLCGLLSVSLFYCVLIGPILYFSNLRTLNFVKKVRKVVTFSLVVILGYFTLVQLALATKEDPVLSFAVYHRFEWSGNWITGLVDNRTTDDINTAVKTDLDIFDFLFGKGKGATMEEFGADGLSLNVMLYNKGILIVAYILLIYILMHNWRKQLLFSIFSILFIFLTFYQRPMLYKIDYFIVFYVGIRLGNRFLENENNTSYPVAV
ncbi:MULTISPECIES: hypothetical protein [Olivibacter]|uniref:Uncharacterized protein n=1 Tax=Olivibacter jilunii TaxID=985016 RepID=A0ABW6B9T9_9SPHI|nr:hypothetical protein [Olivibacter sp. UJ_SKK_5.1]MDX3912660.1 hypothetical protein [Pseudosphingobacterium sp.]